MIPESVARLARKIADLVPRPLKRSLFASTGSESNEAALKMAKLVTGGFEVVALGGSWHALTALLQRCRQATSSTCSVQGNWSTGTSEVKR